MRSAAYKCPNSFEALPHLDVVPVACWVGCFLWPAWLQPPPYCLPWLLPGACVSGQPLRTSRPPAVAFHAIESAQHLVSVLWQRTTFTPVSKQLMKH
eukprot:scaffold364979_cov33-Prasinocladus_malaysianus.AAC.1